MRALDAVVNECVNDIVLMRNVSDGFRNKFVNGVVSDREVSTRVFAYLVNEVSDGILELQRCE